MDLKSKLARLRDAGPGSRKAPVPEPVPAPVPEKTAATEDAERLAKIERLRGLIRQVMERDPLPEPVEPPDGLDVRPRELPGSLRDTEHGPVHVADEHLEPSHCQGRQPLSPALTASSETLARLAFDPTLKGVDPSGMLLLDTETTGLVGGTGTVPFLIGLGWFEDQSLHVEQLFLRDLGEERPLLTWLARRLAEATLLVTYNGKTFDWPLIRTRYVMNQLPVPAVPAHLDLLHCARRIYQRRLGKVRLVHVEEEVLGMRREDDIEGFEIPIRYLDYLRTGDTARLVPVIEHNAHDVVSLAAVLARLATRFEELDLADEPADHLGYAKVAQRAGLNERALEFARAAAAGGGGPRLTAEALLLEAGLARKLGDLDAEEEALTEALVEARRCGELAAQVRLRLSKLYEHRRKDPVRALAHAAHTVPAEDESERAHRMTRLTERIARHGGDPRQPRLRGDEEC